MRDLAGKIALVTRASRGVGKGIALGLGEAGATVYLTGRTVEEDTGVDGLPGTIHRTAREVKCRHLNAEDVAPIICSLPAKPLPREVRSRSVKIISCGGKGQVFTRSR